MVTTDTSFKNLFTSFSETVSQIPDFRRLVKKIKYTVHEIYSSAFAMMYFQDPSLNHFQKRMKEATNQSNLGTMFKVDNIPRQKRMRTFIDKIEPKHLYPAFTDILRRLEEARLLEQFQFKGKYLCPIDGTLFFIDLIIENEYDFMLVVSPDYNKEF